MERGFYFNDICLVSANLVFYLHFNFCNLIFALCFYNFLFWSNCITSRRYLFSFCNIYLVSAIWYFIFCYSCVLVYFFC